MAINEVVVGTKAAEFMEELARIYGPEASLKIFGIVAVVDLGDGRATTRFTFADGAGEAAFPHEVVGMLQQVADVARGLKSPDAGTG